MVLAALVLFAGFAPQPAWAQSDLSGLSFQAAAEANQTLFLLVYINGRDTGAISEFQLLLPFDRMSAQAQDLELAGLAVPRALGKTVFLDQISGLSYDYDPDAQAMYLTVPPAMLMPVALSAVAAQDPLQAQGGYGVVLNYQVSSNLGDNILFEGFRPSTLFAGLELRAVTPFGVLTQTGSLNADLTSRAAARFSRYDTAFTLQSPSRMLSLTLGDVSTGGLAWTRPVRMGGVQLHRDFSLRDDVMTNPLLSYAGMANLPSTLEVYVDNVRAYSGAIEPGPFTLSHVPMITSSGEAVFVLRDEGGSEQVARVPFFATQSLLAKGVLDYSLDHGRLRRAFGNAAENYSGPAASAVSLRYGVTDRLTLEAHGETMAGLAVVGLGLGAALFHRAEINLAAGKSQNGVQSGGFWTASLRSELLGVGLRLRMRRNLAGYQDLSTAFQPQLGQDGMQATDALFLTFPPRAKGDSFGLSLIHTKRDSGSNLIVSASYGFRRRVQKTALRFNAFQDLVGDGGAGVSMAVSMPLGLRTYLSADLRQDSRQGGALSSSLSRHASRAAGSFGYTLNLSDTAASVRGTYQSRIGRAELVLNKAQQRVTARASLEGALVFAGGGLFASPPIQDAFAVVKLGVPQVPVQLNNREAARTGLFGRALLPDLQSYRINKISVNPLDVPLDINLAATAQDVVPARGGGVTVDFRGGSPNAAIVVLRDVAGGFVPSGAIARLRGTGEDFVVGYDGEVWVEGLHKHNRLSVSTQTSRCEAAFAYEKVKGLQAYIEGVICK